MFSHSSKQQNRKYNITATAFLASLFCFLMLVQLCLFGQFGWSRSQFFWKGPIKATWTCSITSCWLILAAVWHTMINNKFSGAQTHFLIVSVVDQYFVLRQQTYMYMLSLDTQSLLPEQSHRPGNLWEILNSMRILTVGIPTSSNYSLMPRTVTTGAFSNFVLCIRNYVHSH